MVLIFKFLKRLVTISLRTTKSGGKKHYKTKKGNISLEYTAGEGLLHILLSPFQNVFSLALNHLNSKYCNYSNCITYKK